MDISFYMPSEIICGADAVKNNREKLSSLGRRCLIITGKSGARKSGALQDVTEVLNKQNIDYRIFDGISENPLLSDCQAAGGLAAQFGADFLIGIGGGSPLDATKAAAVYAKNPTVRGEEIFALKHRGAFPFCLIGTTAGTGSEVTSIAVLTCADGRKRSIKHPDCFARLVFADWRYTCSAPEPVTVSTALDALCHVTEGYFSPLCNDLLDLFAYKALGLLGKCLPALEGPFRPSDAWREELYIASLYAGLVLSRCGTGFPHPLGYILTERYGLAHGRASAVFLPEFLARAAAYEPARMEVFEKKIGMEKSELESLIKRLHGFSVRIPADLADSFPERFKGNQNFARSPGGFTPELAAKLYTKLFL